MIFFSLKRRLELEEGKLLLGLSTLKVFISVLKITEHSNRFAIFKPEFREDPKTTRKLNELTEQKRNENKLHVEEDIEKGLELKIGDKMFRLSDLQC